MARRLGQCIPLCRYDEQNGDDGERCQQRVGVQQAGKTGGKRIQRQHKTADNSRHNAQLVRRTSRKMATTLQTGDDGDGNSAELQQRKQSLKRFP